MICSNCGAELKEDARFCGKCGNKTEVAVVNKTVELKPDVLPEMKPEINVDFSVYSGEEKIFTLNEKKLIVPAELDKYIYYRTKFYELAKACADAAAYEYKSSVHDLETFLDLFPEIYDRYLRVLIDKALDILICEDVYTYSADKFEERHKRDLCKAMSYYNAIETAIMRTLENNGSMNHGVAGAFSSLFSKKSSLVQSLVSGFAEGLADELTDLTPAQKTEIYQRLKPDLLFSYVFNDYWNSVAMLVLIMRENGKEIWFIDSSQIGDISTVLQSMSNPNFPSNKVIDILFDFILKKPNEAAIFKMMEERFGLTEEVKAIFKYFIYPEFSLLPYDEKDFPPQEEVKENNNPVSPQNQPVNNVAQPETQNSPDATKNTGSKLKAGLKIGAGLLAAGALFGTNSRLNREKEERRAKDQKRDLLGSSNCVLGKKDPKGRTMTCVDCSVYVRNRCTRY